MTTKTNVRKRTNELINDAAKHMKANLKKLLDSDAIDYTKFDDNWRLPKNIMVALLEDMALEYSPKGTTFEKEDNKNIKKLKLFL